MLFIKQQVLSHICDAVISSDVEQGFILGSQTRLDQLDYCREIPAVQASLNFYKPNSVVADTIIQQWANTNVCFSGYLHTHIGEKNDFSEADVAFAKKLYNAYQLPLLWFGLAVVNASTISLYFYSVEELDGTIQIVPTPYQSV